MNAHRRSLDVIDIASPCPASWDAMHGDARVRFCGECKLHVYNLSEMTRSAAERLLREHEGRLCARFYRRADGTIVTRDCSRIRAAARRTRQLATAIVSALLCAALAPFGFARTHDRQAYLGRSAVPATRPATEEQPLAGEIVLGAMPAPSTQPMNPPATQPATRPADPRMGGIAPAK